MKYVSICLLMLTLAACAVPVDAPPDPTPIYSATPQPALPTLEVASATPVILPSIPTEFTLGEIPALLTAIPENPSAAFCQDVRALRLLQDLQAAIQTRDGEALAAKIHPVSGLGVRYIRDGNVITYFDNIRFIFETTYQADWGLGAGSGLPVQGSFQEIVLPSLNLVFSANPSVLCQQLKVGGATYEPVFPYEGMSYYSVFFPGTEQYGYMDWETWVVGMTPQGDDLFLTALVHFAWEP